MTFEEELYGAMCMAYPTTTVRSFSQWLGKSEGYWSSITAQGLPVSNTALMHLNDYIECRKMLIEHSERGHKPLSDIQRMIAREIVQRFSLENESFEAVWDEVSQSLRTELGQQREHYGAMPFVMSSRF